MSESQHFRVRFRLVWGFVLLGWLNSSCMFGWSVIRQEAKGNYEIAARIADQLRFEPRGRAARARARALVHLEQYEHARAVLLRDFRHGGEIKSLLALADLELKLNRDGMALAHYTRVLAIDIKALRNKVRICGLFDQRGRMMERVGEMLAADADFRRVDLICPTYSGQKGESRNQWMTLRSRVRKGARRQLTLQKRLETSFRVPQIGDAEEGESTIDASASVVQKFRLAAEQRSELSIKDLIEILAGEFRDELGPWIVRDQLLSSWLGRHTWSELQPIIETMDPSVGQYILFRIGRLLNKTTDTSSSGILPSWRMLVLRGELEQAKIVLSDLATSPNSNPGSYRDLENKKALLGRSLDRKSRLQLKIAESRIAELQGDFALSMRLLLDVVREEQNEGSREFRNHEVLRQLGRGQAWNALALLPERTTDSSNLEVENLRRVSLIMLRLLQIGGGQSEVQHNRIARELKGETWTSRQLELANHLSLGTKSGRDETCRGEIPRHRFDASESWRSYFHDGTTRANSRLGQYLSKMKMRPDTVEEPQFAMLAIEEFEKDLSLQSLGAWVIPLLERGGHIPLLSALMERLIHVPELVSVGQLETLGIMALALQKPSRAILYFRRAAAQSTDPYTVWSKVAHWGMRYESREVELLGIKQAMMHRPEFGLFEQSGWLWEVWIVRRLMDAANDPYLRKQVPHAVEAWHREIGDYFSRISFDQRSTQVSRALLQAKERLSDDPRAFSLVIGLLRSGIKDGRIDRKISEGLELFSKDSSKDVRNSTALFELPFNGGFDNKNSATIDRTTTLIANAIVGDLPSRRRAWQQLLAEASRKDREELAKVLLYQNAALDVGRISGEGENWGLCSFVPDELELLYMILGMNEKSNRS